MDLSVDLSVCLFVGVWVCDCYGAWFGFDCGFVGLGLWIGLWWVGFRALI